MTAPAAAVTRERVRDLHSLLPIPMDRWAIAWLAAISALAGGFLLMGVDGAYVGLLVVFMFVWLHSVHMAGGLKSLVGVCIGYMGLQQVVISQFAKLMMWQRPDTPLLDPTGTMQLYVVAAVAIWCGAALSRAPWLGVVRPILVTDLSTEKLRIIAIVATVLMILRYLGSPAFGSHGVRWLMNLSFLTALAVAAATAWEVKRSEGKRMLNTLNVINLLVPFAAALATFQRREAVYSLIVMVVVAYLYGFRFRAKHVLMGVAILYFFQFIIFPFVVAFRGEYKRLDIFGGQFGKAWTLFLDVAANGSKYNVEEASAPPPADWDARRLLYYDHRPSPTLDRYSLIIVTDAMKAATDTQGATGWQSIVEGSSMVIPRFLNPNKRLLGTSNELAQRVPGLAADTDRTTQISLGLMTEGYASFKLAGVFWVCFLCTFIMAMVLKVTTGDMLPGNLWSGSLVVFLPWVYSEATVGSLALSLFETQPLLLASGLFLILLANSLTRRPNRQQELIEEPATFETKSLRMSS